MKNSNFIFTNVSLPTILILLCISCTNTKYATYFNNVQDTSFPAPVSGLEPIIQKGDLLSISVSSASPDATYMFNAANYPNGSGNLSSSSLSQAVGYLVNQNGTIDFPLLGSLQVIGMTKDSLSDFLTKSLEEKKLLFNPIVTVRYLNFHVTVLGEVNKPGVVNIANEQATLLEALGLAGDITIYGKRDNVLLLRKENGKKIVRRLDLNSDKLLTSQYYFLKSNDVVYVEPNNKKIASVNQSKQWAAIILSGLSLIIVVADHIGH